MPVTTCAATRVGLVSVNWLSNTTKIAAPSETSVVGPQSREALAPLPLEADGAAKQDGDDQIERVVPERGIEQEWHRPLFDSDQFAQRPHPGENAPARKKIRARKPGSGRRRPGVIPFARVR